MGFSCCLGSEVNILDAQGTCGSGDSRRFASMDVVIASLHTPCMKPASKLENTESLSECDEESICKYYRTSG